VLGASASRGGGSILPRGSAAQKASNRRTGVLTFDTTAASPEPLGILFFHSAGWKHRSKSAPVGSPFRSSNWTPPVAFRGTSFRANGRLSLGRASPAGVRTRSGVGYGHDAVRAFESSSGVAAPVPAGRRSSHSYRRLLDAVPAPPRTGHAPKPRNPVASAPRSCPASSSHPRRRRLIENHQRGA
jgi:hypothetical protein